MKRVLNGIVQADLGWIDKRLIRIIPLEHASSLSILIDA